MQPDEPVQDTGTPPAGTQDWEALAKHWHALYLGAQRRIRELEEPPEGTDTREALKGIIERARVTMVHGGCNVPGYVGGYDVRFHGDDWPDLVAVASSPSQDREARDSSLNRTAMQREIDRRLASQDTGGDGDAERAKLIAWLREVFADIASGRVANVGTVARAQVECIDRVLAGGTVDNDTPVRASPEPTGGEALDDEDEDAPLIVEIADALRVGWPDTGAFAREVIAMQILRRLRSVASVAPAPSGGRSDTKLTGDSPGATHGPMPIPSAPQVESSSAGGREARDLDGHGPWLVEASVGYEARVGAEPDAVHVATRDTWNGGGSWHGVPFVPAQARSLAATLTRAADEVDSGRPKARERAEVLSETDTPRPEGDDDAH